MNMDTLMVMLDMVERMEHLMMLMAKDTVQKLHTEQLTPKKRVTVLITSEETIKSSIYLII
jgi:hypothetical protein